MRTHFRYTFRHYLKPILTFLFCCSTLSLSAQEKITLGEIQELFMPDDHASKMIHFTGRWAGLKSQKLFYTINDIHKNKPENLEIYVIVSHKDEEQKKDFQKWFGLSEMDLTYYEAEHEVVTDYFIENRAESYVIDHQLKCSWIFDEDYEKHSEQLLQFVRKLAPSNPTIDSQKILVEESDQIISILMNASMNGEKPITGLLAYLQQKGGVEQLTTESQHLIKQAADGSIVSDMTEKQLQELIRITFLKMEELLKQGMSKDDFPKTILALKNAKEHIKNEEQAADDTVKVEGTFSPVEYKKPAPKKAIEQAIFEGNTYQIKVTHVVRKYGNKQPATFDDTIEKGELIKIEAKGRVLFGAFAGEASPDGFPNNLYKEYNSVDWMNHGALYGGIISTEEFDKHKGASFKVVLFGSQAEFIAPETGNLVFVINDKEIGNNSGHFDITIKRFAKVN